MRSLFIIFFVIIFFACNQAKNSVPVKDKFDAIEKIVGTANWQLVDGQDTSYLYFSRLRDALFNVYHFRIDKGDSVNTTMYTIIGYQDTVVWNWENEKLLLTDIAGNKIVWDKIADEKSKYILSVKDSQHLLFSFPGGHEAIMKKTLPLATFLIRSHYDYLNGTHMVDSAIVLPRGIEKK